MNEVSQKQKAEALACVPSITIEDMLTEIPGVSHVLVRMSFLFGATSSRYYSDMDSALDGSYSHLRRTVYSMCRRVEGEDRSYG